MRTPTSDQLSTTLRRGDVVRVRLDPVVGSEQAGERPGVIISPDIINRHSPVVIIAAITSKKTDRIYPFEVPISPPDGGLTMISKASLMQIRSVDKGRIGVRLGTLSEETLTALDAALGIAIGLTRL